MTIFLNEKVIRLHELISKKSTGTPDQLAKKLSCCKRTILYKIEELRDGGLPIAWDAHRQTYYYTDTVRIDISVTLGAKEMKKVIGGSSNEASKRNYIGDNFCTGKPEFCFVFREYTTG